MIAAVMPASNRSSMALLAGTHGEPPTSQRVTLAANEGRLVRVR